MLRKYDLTIVCIEDVNTSTQLDNHSLINFRISIRFLYDKLLDRVHFYFNSK